MSTTLRVFVGEQWPERPATRWVLLDAAGGVTQQGESDGLRWPVADFCEAVISAPEASYLKASVPQRVSKRDLPQVVGSVLEDQLLDDPDRCHLTLCGYRRDEADVLVVSRVRLRNILAQFEALGRPLSAAYSELQTLPMTSPEWIVALAADAAILVPPGQTPMALDNAADGLPSPLLAGIVEASPSAAAGFRMIVHPEPGHKVDLPGWKSALGRQQIGIGAEHRWYLLIPGAADLLHGEFASTKPRNNTWLLVRPAFLVAAAAIAAYLAVGLVQLGFSKYRTRQAETRIAELFASAFPGVPAVAPLAQTRRKLDLLRAAHGQARSDDMVILLAAVADVMGTEGENSLRELNYADRRLTLTLDPAQVARAEDWRRQLQERGYQVAVRTTPRNLTSLTIELDMTK